nr:collagen binding domain-containing protein [Paenibacillus sp. GSMTC-2017]
MKLTTQAAPDTVIASVYQTVTETVYYSNPDVRIDIGAQNILVLDYEFEIPDGHNYTSGDTYIFTLPDALVLHSDIKNKPLESAPGEPSIGTLQADKNSRQVTLTFNEQIKEGAGAKGTLHFWTYFTQASVKNQTEVLINFGIGEDLKIKLKPTSTNSNPMTKSGSTDKSKNPTKITWTIDVNKDLKQITNATLSDKMPDGLAYIDNSLKVNKLNTSLNGNTTLGESVYPSSVSAILPSNPDYLLQVQLGNIDSAYRVSFETSITDFTKKSFRNDATFIGDNGISAGANATVNQDRGKLLEGKSVTNYTPLDEHKIDWLIKYNYGEQPIAGKVITDLFDGRLDLIEESIKIVPVEDVNNDWKTGTALVKDTDYTISKDVSGVTGVGDKKGFILTFIKNSSSAYKISYQTKAAADYYVVDSSTVLNTVSSEGSNSSASHEISQQFFHKGYTDHNYEARTIDWEVRIQNGNKYDLSNIELDDTFAPNVLKLVPGSIVVKRDGVTVTDSVYTIEYKGGTESTIEGFKIKFKDSGKYAYTITYKTQYDYDVNKYVLSSELKNTAILSWVVGGKPDTKTKESIVPLNQQTVNNGFKNGSYDAISKQITWNIGINYNSKKMNNVVVKDELTSVQKLVNESIEVKEMTVKPGGGHELGKKLTLDTDYTVEITEAAGKTTITVKFTSIDRPYHISFKTELEDEFINDKTITNTAVLSATGFAAKNLVGSVVVNHANEYVYKTGKQNADDIYIADWSIWINRGQSTVNNAKIIDVPSTKQMVPQESFTLYETNVLGNGTVQKGKAIDANSGVYKLDFLSVNAPDFEAQLTTLFGATDAAKIITNIKADKNAGEEIFVLSFLKQINKPYLLEYQSVIDAKHNETIENSIAFIGTGVALKKSDNEVKIQVQMSGGRGTGGAYRGSIDLTKTEESLPSTKLAGAQFRLTHNTNASFQAITRTTDSNGKIQFNNLPYGTYTLKEITPPTGYSIIGNGETTVKIKSRTVNAVSVENKKVVVPTPTPVVPTPTPVVPTPTPVVPTPTPVVPTPTPVVPTPTPVVPTPSPVVPTPSPVDPTPSPVDPTPSPVDPTPSPVVPTPSPVVPTPSPVVPTPSPVVPTPSPVVPTPSPVVPTPSPVVPTPSPVVPTPSPVVGKEDTIVEGEVDVPRGGVTDVGKKPDNGTVTVKPDGTWTYKPDPDFSGKDSFTVIVTDEDGNEEEILIEIEVEEVPEGNIDTTPDVDKLPKTGESSYLLLYLIGTAFIGGGIVLRLRRTRRTN